MHTTLSQDIKALDEKLNGKIDTLLDEKLNGKIDTLGNRLDEKIDALGSRLDGKIDAVNANLGERITQLSDAVAGMRGLQKATLWLMGILGSLGTVGRSLHWFWAFARTHSASVRAGITCDARHAGSRLQSAPARPTWPAQSPVPGGRSPVTSRSRRGARVQSPRRSLRPATPPSTLSTHASNRNCPAIEARVAPSAMRKPISPLRSFTLR